MVVLLSLAACTDDTEYTAGVWYRRSDFDGVARTDAAGFTIGNVGYLCTGYRGSTKDRLKDIVGRMTSRLIRGHSVHQCPMQLQPGMRLQVLQ